MKERTRYTQSKARKVNKPRDTNIKADLQEIINKKWNEFDGEEVRVRSWTQMLQQIWSQLGSMKKTSDSDGLNSENLL